MTTTPKSPGLNSARPRPSRLLLEERCLVLQPGLARAFGILGALLLQQIYYWLQSTGGIDDADGNHWTWHSASDFKSELGGAVDETTIRRELRRLSSRGVLIEARRADIDPKADRWDRSLAYRIDHAAVPDGAAEADPPAKCSMHPANGRVEAARSRLQRDKTPVDIGTEKTSKNTFKEEAEAPRAAAGVKCWNEEDRTATAELIIRAGRDRVQKAASRLREQGIDPLPSRVKNCLQRSGHLPPDPPSRYQYQGPGQRSIRGVMDAISQFTFTGGDE